MKISRYLAIRTFGFHLRLIHALQALALAGLFAPQIVTGQGTAFTYQGRLTDNGSPASGIYDLRFTVYGTLAGGSPLGGPVTNSPTVVNNGLFSVQLDFGSGIFTGAERWLEIATRTNGGGAFVPLAPRQQLSASPYAIAARDVTGVLQPGNIGAGTITSIMMADGSIHSNHLAVGSVHSNALIIGSIHSNHLAAGTIHSNHLAGGSVTAFALANDSVHSNHLAAGSVHSNALIIGSIHSNHLAIGSIHSNHLADGSVTALALADASIHSNHLAVGSVHSNALILGSVTALALADGTIHSNHLAAGSVHSNALILGSVTALALADDSVHSNHLAVGSVHSNALAFGSIHSNHLAVGSIHSNALALGSVTAFALADNSIHSNHLAAGSVHSNALILGSVTASALADGSIHSNHLAAGSIHSNALAFGSIHSNHLAAGSVHSNALALGSVTANALAADSVHSNALVIGSIHSNHLAVGAVTADKLATTLSGSFSTTVTNPSPANFVQFGGAVAAVGTDKFLVGAYLDSSGQDNAGAAYLFSTGGTLVRSFIGVQNQEHFGFAVAGVGPDKVLIGADGSDTGALDAGVAYLYSTNGTLVTTLTNPTPAASDSFGYAVAAVGADKVLIGAYADHFGANLGGAAYLFTTNRTLLTTFTNPTPANDDRFGIALAAVGSNMVLIGADRDDAGATDAGVAYLFHTNGTLLATFTNPTPVTGDSFGSAVAGVGPDKVLIGAFADNSNGNAGGAAYLFSTSGALLRTFTNPTPASGDQFGVSVAAVGTDALLIGAAHDSGGGTDAGAAYLFSTGGDLLSTFNNPAPAPGDFFGNALTMVGSDKLLIAAARDDTGATDTGAVYLFTLGSVLPGLVADTVRDGAITAAKLDSTIGLWTRSGNDVFRPAGNVGIGTTAPQNTLQLNGNNSHLRLHDTARGNFWHIYTENHPNAAISGNLLFMPGPTGVYGFIQKSTGNYFSSSDVRLKKDITDLGGVLDRVLHLRPVSYRFQSAPESSSPTFGLIAQEVESLFPEVVAEHDGMKALAYSELVPVTVGAIQELNQKLEETRAELKRRDAENAELKARLEKIERWMVEKHRDAK